MGECDKETKLGVYRILRIYGVRLTLTVNHFKYLNVWRCFYEEKIYINSDLYFIDYAACLRLQKNSGETENINSETSVTYNTSFENMPKMSYENVVTYFLEDTVIFEYINPGLDSFSAEVVSYSLSQDKVLGQLSLGEGNFQLSVTENGFAVIDLTKNTVDYFGKDCSKTGSVKVFENNMLGFSKLSRDGNNILA